MQREAQTFITDKVTQTFERGEDMSDTDLQALEEAFGELQGQRFQFLSQRLKEQKKPPIAEL